MRLVSTIALALAWFVATFGLAQAQPSALITGCDEVGRMMSSENASTFTIDDAACAGELGAFALCLPWPELDPLYVVCGLGIVTGHSAGYLTCDDFQFITPDFTYDPAPSLTEIATDSVAQAADADPTSALHDMDIAACTDGARPVADAFIVATFNATALDGAALVVRVNPDITLRFEADEEGSVSGLSF